MSYPQTAILPEASPFALYALFKIKNNPEKVLRELKQLPELTESLNASQAGADVKLSVSFSRHFWAQLDAPAVPELVDFVTLGNGDISAPASDVDFLIHAHSLRHDLLFYVMRKFMGAVAEEIQVVDETYGFRYLDARDMTGFIDGTENPADSQREEVAIIPEGELAGGSYVMVQRFVHNLPAWERLNVAAQEKVIGRTKEDSVELEQVPEASHVGRVDLKENGKGLKILRHSLPYGTVGGEHGLLFIAYCHTLHNFKAMLQSMYGETDGKTDQMLRFTQAATGAYLFSPSREMLQSINVK
ncbi:putative deferrochelatase/peroxidase YfeX [Vibrio aerogenes CECT 7868]|uniref:Putative deferrochelatase/peroxidase YfeX n=1 Tax=Vibrio aerogenes CECT 7868 TaxID=1216006 RepID=A0A1M5W833_9VIBR|nr:Dyp-type peroxidase [Vibrio aerogenes]SHH83621.1 putative deferrochelatase/peroxidase YfeX [Vibrio aerogenes CECT 7868]